MQKNFAPCSGWLFKGFSYFQQSFLNALAVLGYLSKLKRGLELVFLVPDPFLILVNTPKQPTHSRNSVENKKNL